MPPSVKEWAAFSTELAVLDEETFRDPLGHGRFSSTGAIWLLEQAEGDLFWGIPANSQTEPDPAVLTLGDDGNPYFTQMDGGDVYATSVAGFALLHLLSYRTQLQVFEDPAPVRAVLGATFPSICNFDQAAVYEAPGRASLMLPANTWGLTQAQLFALP